MLHPDTTVLLTDALRPPAGCEVDQAVATTYSLTLTAMLIAPMTFTLGTVDDADALASADPVRLLDAVERHVEHTTVFVQAGGIHVPTSHSRIHAFLEDSIHEVVAPREGNLFHPKLWAVRYVDDAGRHHHRVVISSRNLTLDNSWDTVLVLDEDPGGAIPAAPAADMVAALPELTISSLSAGRRRAVEDLARSLRRARLAAPAPFTGGYLLPLGLDDSRPWPFPEDSARILAISPFLSGDTLTRVRGNAADATVVSRPESMDLLGRRRLAGWSTNVLHRAVEEANDDAAPVRASDEFTAVREDDGAPAALVRLEGLHAKTVVLDRPGGQSMTVTGSANLTDQAWGGGVEMGAVLTGPTATCGVDAVLGADTETGLGRVLQSYTPQADDGAPDPAIATSYQLEEFHRTLARNRPRLEVTPVDEHRVLAHLTLTLPPEPPGHTRIWLTTVEAQKRPLAHSRSWEIDPVNVTPYLAVETTAGEGQARVTRRCVLMMRIEGDPLDRRRAALAAILSSSRSVLRYLALLLGMDPLRVGAEAAAADSEVVTAALPGTAEGSPERRPPLVLFEPLVRAAARGPQDLAGVARQVQELREMPGAADMIPSEFLQMWDVVLQSVQARRRS